MTEAVEWYPARREDLPDLLLGDHTDSVAQRSLRGSHLSRGDEITLGFDAGDAGGRPVVVVLNDETAADTFSWLQAFAPRVMPLSHVVRVVLRSEWEAYSDQHPRGVDARTAGWASMIVGEAMAQAGTGADLREVPVSRSTSCFTYAVARARALHGTSAAIKVVGDRLRQLEADQRIARRPVPSAELAPLWNLLESNWSASTDPVDVALTVVDLVGDATGELWGASRQLFQDTPELLGESVEDRVRAFHRVVGEIDARRGSVSARDVQLAAAAFLVGRGTSHSFLLHPHSSRFPTALVWFGAIAGIASPWCWDDDWSKLTRSVQRGLVHRFRWDDASVADLCWAEYFWLASTTQGLSPLVQIPRSVPRTLTVEIVPGASCQVRLDAERSPESSNAPSEHEVAMRQLLVEFTALADRSRALLGQRGVGREDARTPQNRSRRAKRSTGE